MKSLNFGQGTKDPPLWAILIKIPSNHTKGQDIFLVAPP